MGTEMFQVLSVPGEQCPRLLSVGGFFMVGLVPWAEPSENSPARITKHSLQIASRRNPRALQLWGAPWVKLRNFLRSQIIGFVLDVIQVTVSILFCVVANKLYPF